MSGTFDCPLPAQSSRPVCTDAGGVACASLEERCLVVCGRACSRAANMASPPATTGFAKGL